MRGGLALDPSDALDSRDGHVTGEFSIIDRGGDINGGEEAFQPSDKGA